MNKILQEASLKFGINLTDDMDLRFSLYAKQLVEINKVMNLTAITDIDEIYTKHFVDSFSCQSLIPQNSAVIDVGTGAGFPGIPLYIVRPDMKLTLLDSLGKRVNFLNEILSLLNLDDAKAYHMRAEDGGQNKNMREMFDVSVSRAVAPLAVLCEYCLPFVKVGGCFLALKGRDANTEVLEGEKAIISLGGEAEEIQELFWKDMKHRVVVIRKVCKTPSMYPRKAGKPSKEPII